MNLRALTVITLFTLSVAPWGLAGEATGNYVSTNDYPLMGDYEGRWHNATKGYEEHNPEMAAQVILIGPDRYRVRFMSRLNLRAAPYLETEVTPQEGTLRIQDAGWDATCTNGSFEGTAPLHGDQIGFSLQKVVRNSPTLAKPAPADATVLFDGSSFDHWKHDDGRAVTWKLVEDNAMEVVSLHWNNKQNEAEGLGGNITADLPLTRCEFHMEFRYPVEPDAHGQMLGNSGVLMNGVGEIQILNSYGLNGYWDECGSIYKVMPAQVNAAAPPLQWQTYDVVLELPEADSTDRTGYLTVRHNGILIHNRLAVPNTVSNTTLTLQDHINPMQFRNIWVRPLNEK